jgi:hypothetical protein
MTRSPAEDLPGPRVDLIPLPDGQTYVAVTGGTQAGKREQARLDHEHRIYLTEVHDRALDTLLGRTRG